MYTAESIQILTGLECIRKRPGMYVGPLEQAERHILFELLDQACEFATSFVRISFDGARIEIEDDGPGIPTEQELLQQIVGSLHAGGSYRARMPTYGTALPIACALATELEVESRHGGVTYVQRFARGKPLAPVHRVGSAIRSGVRVSYTPDRSIVPEESRVEREDVRVRCRELAALFPSLTLIFEDEGFRCPDGLADLVRYHAGERIEVLHRRGEVSEIEIEIALAWGVASRLDGFVGTRRSRGSHVDGLFVGLHHVLARRTPAIRSLARSTCRRRIAEGLAAAIRVETPDPRWCDQLHQVIANPEIEDAVIGFVDASVDGWFAANPAICDLLALRFDRRC